MATRPHKKVLILSMRKSCKRNRKMVWEKLLDLEKHNSKLTLSKTELLKILENSFDRADLDREMLFEIMKKINPNLQKNELIRIYDISEPLWRIFCEETERNQTTA